jgi:uncharacterized protein YpuA (DUF1002 family)
MKNFKDYLINENKVDNIEKEYNLNITNIEKEILRIQKMFKEHKKGNKTWGHVADMSNILEKLKEIRL